MNLVPSIIEMYQRLYIKVWPLFYDYDANGKTTGTNHGNGTVNLYAQKRLQAAEKRVVMRRRNR